ncbi:MAG: dockerin type I domain-containing protein [Pseudomonadota bacterium]|nr:dockerin type I domain-containing protein [Pseudomonadota bacterium]
MTRSENKPRLKRSALSEGVRCALRAGPCAGAVISGLMAIAPAAMAVSPFPAEINLGALDGTNGFTLKGIDAGDYSGVAVSGAGDINGDGLDDVLVGAPDADGEKYDEGESYVVFGRGGCFPAALDLGALDGTNGFVLKGIDEYDLSGGAVSGAGDINGDGLDDVFIGADAYHYESGGLGEGYVIFGRAEGFSASIDLGALDGSDGFVLRGGESGATGASVSDAGDVDGDGIDDILIGAHSGPYSWGLAGAAYVIFGHTGGFAPVLDLGALDGTNGFVLNGIDENDLAGMAVSGAGDVNGDGLDDVLIGAPGADPDGKKYAGESYVVFGRAGSFPAAASLGVLNGTNGFVLKGIDAYDDSGSSVSGAGDFNGDGFDDVLIGARDASPDGKTGAGESYVVFGGAGGFPAELQLGALDGTNGLVLKGIDAGDRSGASVAGAGDVNGDGVDDILVGAKWADPDGKGSAGESYVVFGGASGFPAEFELSSLDGANGLVLKGIDAGDRSGVSVTGAGDVNGDGVGDILIGASLADPDGKDRAGESYVVFGATCDVDGNGSVDRGDVVEFIRQCRSDPCKSWCDLNGDGRITRSDAVALVQRCRSGTAALAESVVEEALSVLDTN